MELGGSMKLVKSVSIRDFGVELYETSRGWYIIYETPIDSGNSDILEQLSVALYLFDLKVQNLTNN